MRYYSELRYYEDGEEGINCEISETFDGKSIPSCVSAATIALMNNQISPAKINVIDTKTMRCVFSAEVTI